MTPQEQELVNELLDRLAKLEGNPRDPDAERLIADGLRRAPNAVYALVQTALVQDEALKRANARIEELQAHTAGESQQHGGFLDSVRDEILGKLAAARRRGGRTCSSARRRPTVISSARIPSGVGGRSVQSRQRDSGFLGA